MKSLILTDNEKLFYLKFKVILKMLGEDPIVMHCNTGSDTINNVTVDFPDIIFLDYDLDFTHETRSEVIKKIKEKQPNIIIGIISETGNKDEIEISKLSGANFWIKKTGKKLSDNLQDFLYDCKNDLLAEFKIYDKY